MDKIFCTHCQKELNPPYDKVYKHGKTILCESCEQERTSNKKSSLSKNKDNTQADKAKLFQTIQTLFCINTIPDWWITQIEKLHKEGKTYPGMEYTLRYAILYNGFQAQEEYGVGGIISMFYKEASEYYAKEYEVKLKNKEVIVKNVTKTVSINKPKSNTWKPTSSIEDL